MPAVSGRLKQFIFPWIKNLISALAALFVLVALSAKIMALQKGLWFQNIGGIIFYLMMFFLFIFRYKTKAESSKLTHWLFALSGTLLPLALQINIKYSDVLNWLSLPMEILGMVLAIISMYTLGMSFGVIAAKREIKTSGVYKLIRHPLYAGEALWFLAMVIQNLSFFNILLFILQCFCQTKRMLEEESLLQEEEPYRLYVKKVPWRVVPALF